MSRGRPAIPRLARLLLLTLVLASVVGPAHAEAPELLVSRSASGPFADQMSGPLLGGAGLLVPMDRAGGTFWVKNATGQPARTTVAVVNRGPANELTDGVTVTVDAGGTRTSGGLAGGRCDLVVTGPTVAPGDVQRVGVDVAVGDLTGQRGMDRDFSLDVDVTLSHLGGSGEVATCGEQAVAEPQDADCSAAAVVTLAGTPRCVPTTVAAGVRDAIEARHPAAAAATGALWLVVGGLLLLVVSRRRRTAEDSAEG